MTTAFDAPNPVVRLHGPGDLRLAVEAVPRPAGGEVLVQVEAVGLCGSDRHWYEDASIGETGLARPLVLGHEFAGAIADGPRRGERVVADPAIACRVCAVCASGREHLCPDVRFAGLTPTDGALRRWVAWPDHLLHPVPDTLDDAEASLLEVLGIALHAVDLGAVEPAMRVGVYGSGPVGLLIVAALRARGVRRIVATDPLAHRVDAALGLGASEGIVVEPAGDRPGAHPAGGEVDVAFECAGEDAAVETAIAAAAPGGRVVLVGIPSPDRTTFRASVARRKGLTIALCRRMRTSDLPAAIRLAASGAIPLGSLVSRRFGLEDATAAFELLRSRAGLKIVVEPGRTS